MSLANRTQATIACSKATLKKIRNYASNLKSASRKYWTKFGSLAKYCVQGPAMSNTSRRKCTFSLNDSILYRQYTRIGGSTWVRRGSRTTPQRHIYEAWKHEFPIHTVSYWRNLLETRSILSDLSCSTKRSATGDYLAESWIFPLFSVLSLLRFNVVHPFVDNYTIFVFDTMYTLSLWISRLLKECPANYHDNSEWTPNTITTKKGFLKTFKHIINVPMFALNSFLREMRRCSSGLRLQVDSSRED